MSTKIAQVTASVILIASVFAILFGTLIGTDELSKEAFLFLGTMTGTAGTFLFLARTKNNGTHVATGNSDV